MKESLPLFFIVSALINVGLNIMLIPAHGTMGAAIATLVAYIALAAMGSFSFGDMKYTFGLIPIEGNDVWLHALIGVVAAIFGWVVPGSRRTSTAAPPPAA